VQKKGNLWFADWRDVNGKRHRRGFSNADSASAFTSAMRKEVAAKKALNVCRSEVVHSIHSEKATFSMSNQGTDTIMADLRAELLRAFRKLVRTSIAQAKRGNPSLLLSLIREI
jgi:hypothetical protein